MTKEDEARDRHNAAMARLNMAELTKVRGQAAMWVGVVLGVAAVVAFTFADPTEIASWVRQVILTLIAIVLSGGMVFYAIGCSDERRLGQAADDRTAQEERHEAEVTLLRKIERNQTFLLGRPNIDSAGAAQISYRVRPPSPDTLDMLDLVRQKRKEEDQAPPEVPKQVEGAGLGELIEKAEWYNLGAAVERRRHDPDAQN